MPRVTSWLARPRLLRALLSQVRLAVRLLRDPTVPLFTKMLPVLAALYVVSPLDIVPDVIPVIGQLDDLGVLAVALEAFLKLCPPGATEFHRTAISHGLRYSPAAPPDDFIDAEWRRE